jgi:hypothetical protein
MHEIQPRKFVNSFSGGPCLIPDFFANPATGISQGSDGGPNLSVNQGAVVTVTTWVIQQFLFEIFFCASNSNQHCTHFFLSFLAVQFSDVWIFLFLFTNFIIYINIWQSPNIPKNVLLSLPHRDANACRDEYIFMYFKNLRYLFIHRRVWTRLNSLLDNPVYCRHACVAISGRYTLSSATLYNQHYTLNTPHVPSVSKLITWFITI